MTFPLISRQQIVDRALALGFHRVGIAAVPPEPAPAETATVAHLQQWLAAGYQADMAWMEAPRRQDIRQVLPGVRSVIAVALNYYSPEPRPEPRPDGPPYAKISRYGWGRDYHRQLHKRLKQLGQWLQIQASACSAEPVGMRYYADTGPVQDKAWAQQAGLGWVGKNGNLITRQYGSWVFLGEVLTTLALPADAPHTDHCGTCRRCLDACPTQAIRAPYVVDANRCIAYHTIENRADTLPPAIARNLQGWVAGCDICQDVCPWNQRFAQPTSVAEFHPFPPNIAPTATELSQLSEADWDQRFRGSALRRIKPAMWRRNAQAVLDHGSRVGDAAQGKDVPEPHPQGANAPASAANRAEDDLS